MAPPYFSYTEITIFHIHLFVTVLPGVDRPSRVFFRVEAARKISDICQAYIKSNKTAMERGKDVELLLFDKKFVFVLRHATVFFLN